MHGAFMFAGRLVIGRQRHGVALRLDVALDLRDHRVGLVFEGVRRRHDPRNAVEDLLIERPGDVLFLALGWHPGVLVVVLGVARRAPGLFDLVAHHGDDGVVRDPALTRTVVVHDISESRLALLHQAP
jgi:hypothetical protein